MSGPPPRSDAVERLLAPAHRYRTLAERGGRSSPFVNAGIEADWFAEHLHALALRFGEPLLARRRASAGLRWPANREAYRLDALSDDLVGAVDEVWEASRAEYERLACKRIRRRRLRLRGARAARLSAAERRGHARRIGRPADPVNPAIHALARSEEAEQWQAARVRLEQEWATAWTGMAAEVAAVWANELAPRLAQLEHLRRGAPAWVLGAAVGLGTIFALLAAAGLLL